MAYEVVVEFDESLSASEVAAVDASAVEALLTRVLEGEAVAEGVALTVLFADDAFLQDLNRDHRGIDEPTDVLSYAAAGSDGPTFPGAPAEEAEEGSYLGDIAVSIPTALRQAEAASLAAGEEIGHLVVHGLLHILGYDHEEPAEDAVMRAREEGYLGPRIHAAGPDAHVLHS